MTRLAMLFTTLVLVVVAGLVFLLFRRSRKNARLAAFICFLLLLGSFASYIGVNQEYVRVVPIPRLGTAQALSVGDQRTEFAKQLGNVDDYELLRDRGAYEEEVEKLWTARSLIKARTELWLSYTASAILWLFLISILVIQHASELPVRSGKHSD